MWLNEQQTLSRRHGLIMDRRVSAIESLPSQFLDTGVDQLPGQLLDTLGIQLFKDGRGGAGNWEGVAEELGINTTVELEQIRRHAQRAQVFPGRLMLIDWGKKSGSTVFVLLNALRRQGREDCIDLVLKACQDVHSMELLVKIEEPNGQSRYLKVTTKKDATLAASLENILSGLPSYTITGPSHKLTWQTPAHHLKGTQLSLKKEARTAESERSAYGLIQLSQQKTQVPRPRDNTINSFDNNINPYAIQCIPVPLNIPVTDQPSVSANFVSTTEPKVPEPFSSLPPTNHALNDLSQHGHNAKALLSSQDVQILSSNPQLFTNTFHSRGPSLAERQTLLKKPSCSIDESVSNTFHSMTAVKHVNPSLNHFQSASMDENDTLMKRCDPMRHTTDRPMKHMPKVMEYIPHTVPISFSNPDKKGMMSSPGQCRRPMPRAKNEDYVNPNAILSGSPSCKPMPCIKTPIHVRSDNMPPPKSTPSKPKVKPKPMPCVLQQRKDGYIDIVAQRKRENGLQGSNASVPMQVVRQRSVPETVPVNTNISEEKEKERPRSLPDEIANAEPPCVLSRDSNGYATFASQNSLMDVDAEEVSGGNVTFSCPVYIDSDVDGYLSYSGASDSTSTNVESAMESDSSMELNTAQSGPMVIQQSTDGYFGFATAPASSSSPQLVSCPAPQACAPTDYVAMNRSESLPNDLSNERNPDGLIYARFSEEDEEEDADYFDMKQLPNIPRNTQSTNVNRHWSEGDIEYLDILPTSSQYDYINENEHSTSRSLPPRPSQPIPMKRRRFRSQDPESLPRPDVTQPCDLDAVPGWCPHETEESICNTMKRYQQEDGNFMVWWMDRKKRYVVTVSHMNELRHYAVYERPNGSSLRLFIFGGGEEFDSMKALVEHYMREGLKGPDIPTGHSRGKRWQQFSHVRLRKPLKVKYIHTVARKKAT